MFIGDRMKYKGKDYAVTMIYTPDTVGKYIPMKKGRVLIALDCLVEPDTVEKKDYKPINKEEVLIDDFGLH